MNRLQKANEYIQNNKMKTTNRPYFHFSPEIGWMNDPNGFSFHKGKYHLFYQYYPYDIVWNDMHWGHASTEDFITWEYLPVALANDKAYDANGCFSGSAIEKDGKLYLMYTAHIDPNLGFDKDESQIFERQAIAVSEDGVNFKKYELNPVIGEKQLPDGYLICDFRDPKVMEVDGVYYCVLSVRNKERRGEIIMFKSNDLLEWHFHSSIYQSKFEENTLLECPDLFSINGRDVLLFSEMPCDPIYQQEKQNTTSYVIGKMDFEQGVFTAEHKGLLDHGQTFYAPQSTEGKNSERLLIGWMHRWHQTMPPKEYGFNGMMSIPRELLIKNNQLIQSAFIDHEAHFTAMFSRDAIKLQNETVEISGEGIGYLTLSVPRGSNTFTVELNKDDEKSTKITVDAQNNSISYNSDYGNQGLITIHDAFKSDINKIELYIDLHSIELFINGGEKVATFTAYYQNKGKNISLSSNDNIELKNVRFKAFRG
ncbi:glycoside hydrolase family 32 protein [Domibacillus iocasae]|uniref:beta-fructofuranosidase n=1 Tax=Domibacillus iocasae TaxID=1714016 RepID=A0A1E7DS32_9BACI|nr:glycoside hydrolase family 32 protein [Domibacillus iocasae]OES45887.1 hypothetical protein BA724_17235 [Domibacillus iocasae]